MKRTFLALCIFCPIFAFADIIVTFSKGNIEDVSVVSVGADEVVYKQGGTQKSVASSDVDGVLYDDGRYVTPPSQNTYTETTESTANDDWAIEDSDNFSNNTQSTRQHRERNNDRSNRERNGGNSEVGQAFKQAGVAIKDAFGTMFNAMKKDKSSSKSSKSSKDSGSDSSDSNDNTSNQSTAGNDENW